MMIAVMMMLMVIIMMLVVVMKMMIIVMVMVVVIMINDVGGGSSEGGGDGVELGPVPGADGVGGDAGFPVQSVHGRSQNRAQSTGTEDRCTWTAGIQHIGVQEDRGGLDLRHVGLPLRQRRCIPILDIALKRPL